MFNKYMFPLAVIGVTLMVSPATAQTITAEWLNPVSGDWREAAKWSTNPQIPNSNIYDAHIDALGTAYQVELITGSEYPLSLHNLLLNSPSATLRHTSGTLI